MTAGASFLLERKDLADQMGFMISELNKNIGVIRQIRQTDADLKAYMCDTSSLPHTMATLKSRAEDIRASLDSAKPLCESCKPDAIEGQRTIVQGLQDTFACLTSDVNDSMVCARLLIQWAQEEHKKEYMNAYLLSERFSATAMLPGGANPLLARHIGKRMCAHVSFLSD